MLYFKQKNLAFVMVLSASLAGCLQTKQAFVFDEQMKASFFQEIPRIAQNTIPKKKDLTSINAINIYRTSFSERLVESNNVIEYAIVNDATKTNLVKYKEFDGYSQQLYLIQLITPGGNEDAFVYLTVKYDADGNCIGFGPSYFGYKNVARNLIKFTAALKIVKKAKGDYQLVQMKPSPSMLFIASSIKSGSPINVQKVVNNNPNKIGGQKALVYTVDEIFKDDAALQFYPIQSIKLNP